MSSQDARIFRGGCTETDQDDDRRWRQGILSGQDGGEGHKGDQRDDQYREIPREYTFYT